MNITRVAIADLPELLPLMRGYCDFYAVAPSDAELRKLSLTLLEHPNTAGLQLIARDRDGTAVGFATLYWTYSTTSASAIGLMNDLYVDPHARLQGLGAALIRACEAECAARGMQTMEWQTAPTNTRAQAVYDRFPAARSEWVTYSLALSPR